MHKKIRGIRTNKQRQLYCRYSRQNFFELGSIVKTYPFTLVIKNKADSLVVCSSVNAVLILASLFELRFYRETSEILKFGCLFFAPSFLLVEAFFVKLLATYFSKL